MDGLVELLFIGIFILATVFDAIARSRRKKGRIEEMEREEEQEERTQPRGGRMPARERESPEETGGVSREGAETRQTADTMVPDDLWAILTGQDRRTEEPKPTEEWEPEEEKAGREPPRRPGSDLERAEAYSDRPRWDPKRRTSSVRVEDVKVEEPPAEPRLPVPVPSDRYGAQPPRTRREIGRGGAEIGEAEIGASDRPELRRATRRPATTVEESVAALQTRSRRSASPYVANLRDGRHGLREAVVLSEVLGAPAGLRRRPGGWTGEPD